MVGLKKFIVENRKSIDEVILAMNPNQQYFNDTEREQWIKSDEGLYNWARSYGVKI